VIRNPVVAGRFYSGQTKSLDLQVKSYIKTTAKKMDALGCVSPHAGYMYSGEVAGNVLSSINPAETYIILGPNHSGMGKRYGLDRSRQWLTPLGKVDVDHGLADAILETSNLIQEDEVCHDYEHSIEVQLPFLQVLQTGFKFVPIVISSGDSGEYHTIGSDLAKVIKDSGKKVTIIASSDMTHYESQNSAMKKDKAAIDKILELDVDGFLWEIRRHDISMCGYAPCAIMMSACKELGAAKASLVQYQTSGDVSGDRSSVVGYAGIIVY